MRKRATPAGKLADCRLRLSYSFGVREMGVEEKMTSTATLWRPCRGHLAQPERYWGYPCPPASTDEPSHCEVRIGVGALYV
jgi:hypothetical protein